MKPKAIAAMAEKIALSTAEIEAVRRELSGHNGPNKKKARSKARLLKRKREQWLVCFGVPGEAPKIAVGPEVFLTLPEKTEKTKVVQPPLPTKKELDRQRAVEEHERWLRDQRKKV